MKKIILILLLAPLISFAQSEHDTTYWNKEGDVGLTFNQASLTN